MKRILLLFSIILLVGLKVQSQTYFTPGIPPSSTSFSPTFRTLSHITDSLQNFYWSNGTKWYQVYTAAQINAILAGRAGTVTSVGSGYGLLGGPITSSGTLLVDTNKIALSDDRILSGMVTTASGTTATTTAGTYRLNGTVYTIGNTNTTIPAQDATLSRFSVIYGTTSGTLSVVNGTLAANPDVPSIPANTLLVSTILITPTAINPTPPPAGKVNANSGLTLKNNVIQLGGNLLHLTNIGFSSTAPLTIIDQANNNGMSIGSSGWNALYQNGTNTTQATIGKTQALMTLQQSSSVTGLVMDYSLGAVFHDDIFSRGINFAANYTTNQRLQRSSVPSVNTVIALADSVKGTISSPVGANPTATAGTSFVNGTATTFMRSDAAPKVDSTVIRSVANSYSLSGMQTKLNNYLLKTDTTAMLGNVVHINNAETILGPKTFNKAITQTLTGLGTTQTLGLMIQNTTAAAIGAQQISPYTEWAGNSWGTTPAASTLSAFRAYVLPVQNSSGYYGVWHLQSTFGGSGAWTDALTLTGDGFLTVPGGITASNISASNFFGNGASRNAANAPFSIQSGSTNNFTLSGDLTTISLNTTASNSSGSYNTLSIYPNINQSGTAGYKGLFIAAYEQATGSGNKYLIDAGTSTAINGGSYTQKWSIDDAGNEKATTSIGSAEITFANRPSSPYTGQICNFSDSTVNTWGATVAGSGSNHVAARYNGTNWTVIGI